MPIPVNSVVPAVTGTVQIGHTLTASTGTWSNTPTSYSYQWKSNGVNVGTDQNTYVPVIGDFKHTITAAVTAINGSGAGTPAASVATAAVNGVADFGVDLTSGTAPMVVNLTYAGTPGGTNTYQWTYSLDGGSFTPLTTPTAQNPTQVLSDSGTYSFRLAATGDVTDTVTKTGIVVVYPSLTGNGVFSPLTTSLWMKL